MPAGTGTVIGGPKTGVLNRQQRGDNEASCCHWAFAEFSISFNVFDSFNDIKVRRFSF